MTYRIVPRTEYGLPATVTNANGTPRLPLKNEPWMTAHYTGNNVDYTGKVTTEVILQIQRIFGKTKPFEYNYVIGQEDNDEIYEFAGKFQAAHSAGENLDSFGVLFLLGVGEEPTPRMIDKWRWLRDVLKADGSLSYNVIELPHSMMPGAATACPGEVHRYMNELKEPWVPQQEDDVATAADVYIAKPPTNEWLDPNVYTANPPWFLVERFGGNARYALNADSTNTAIEQTVVNAEQYRNLYRSVFG